MRELYRRYCQHDIEQAIFSIKFQEPEYRAERAAELRAAIVAEWLRNDGTGFLDETNDADLLESFDLEVSNIISENQA